MSDLTDLSARLIMSAPRYYDRDDYKVAAKALEDLLKRSGRSFDRDQKRLARKYEAQIDAAREANDREVEKLIEAEKVKVRQTERAVTALIEREEAS